MHEQERSPDSSQTREGSHDLPTELTKLAQDETAEVNQLQIKTVLSPRFERTWLKAVREICGDRS
jgi:hypothetical protein